MNRRSIYRMVSYIYFCLLFSVLQTDSFSVDEYLKFKDKNKNLTGRIDFFMTPPPPHSEQNYSRQEIRRMCCGSLILNEILLNPQINTTY
ncbi:MAG: hypothetical protein PVI26_06950 [Chitinispirillia bacterium]|jgi:hypothetical protein